MAPESFGPYRLEHLIGRGGMGEVYRAFDTEHDRDVALKRLGAHLADDEEFRTRFRQEARLAAKLRSPHIVPIHRFGELEGRLFIDMRLVEGFDAAELIDSVGALAPSRAVSIVEQAASALETAHTAGLVHRDVKPSNLLLEQEGSESDSDFVYLADFGITKQTSATRSYSLTRTGALLGSLDYMAPEQFDGVADRLVDVYSLTCVLFELLTGLKPYAGKGLPALMHAHLNVPPPRPSAVSAALEPFDEVIRRGMAKSVDARVTSAAELARLARGALDAMGDVSSAVTVRLNREEELARISQKRLSTRFAKPPVPRHVLATEPAELPTARIDDCDVEDDPTSAGPAEALLQENAPLDPVQGQTTEHGPVVTVGADESAAVGTPDRTTIIQTRPLDDLAAKDVDVRRSRRVGLSITAAIAVVVLVVVVVVLVGRSGGGQAAGPGEVASPPTSSAVAASPPASAASPQVIATVPVGQAPQGLALSPDGKTCFVANTASRTVSLIDLSRHVVTGTLSLSGVPRYVTASADGRRLFVSMFADDGSGSGVAVIDLATSSEVGIVATGPKPYALSTAPDGRIWVPNHDTSSVSVINPETLSVEMNVVVSNNPHSVGFSADGHWAYSANHESNSMAVIDTATGTVKTTVPVGNSPHDLAVSLADGQIAVANYGDGTASIVNSAADRVTASFPVGNTAQSITYSVDGAHLYAVDESGNAVTAIDAATGLSTGTTPVGTSPRYILVTPDGAEIVVSNSDSGTVSLLSATTS